MKYLNTTVFWMLLTVFPLLEIRYIHAECPKGPMNGAQAGKTIIVDIRMKQMDGNFDPTETWKNIVFEIEKQWELFEDFQNMCVGDEIVLDYKDHAKPLVDKVVFTLTGILDVPELPPDNSEPKSGVPEINGS